MYPVSRAGIKCFVLSLSLFTPNGGVNLYFFAGEGSAWLARKELQTCLQSTVLASPGLITRHMKRSWSVLTEKGFFFFFLLYFIFIYSVKYGEKVESQKENKHLTHSLASGSETLILHWDQNWLYRRTTLLLLSVNIQYVNTFQLILLMLISKTSTYESQIYWRFTPCVLLHLSECWGWVEGLRSEAAV